MPFSSSRPFSIRTSRKPTSQASASISVPSAVCSSTTAR
ncbi:hypothetical protein OG1X_1866 [Enterococcus faecalis OG1X]|nr:hypothetical protein OG1X_1866 [Enterococcus faecalis OG1X]